MRPLRCTNAPATASLFVRLSMCRQAVPGRIPILDLFLPLRFRVAGALPACSHHTVATGRTRSARHASLSCNTPSGGRWSGTRPRAVLPDPRAASLRFTTRVFSTSSPLGATHAIFNPQVDDEGKEMVLEITPRAAKRLSDIMAKDSNPFLALRIQVESGGCHGFQYLMKLVTLPSTLPTKDSPAPPPEEDASAAIHEDDTIFTYSPDDKPTPGDLSAPKIILDLPSLELLKGSKVDFTMELIGSQFKIVDNPLATSNCGCGTSFDIKI